MTILSMNRKELEKRIGVVDDSMQKAITDMGTPIEDVINDEVSVEIFPNRPDLLSLENIALAINQYNGKAKIQNFFVQKSKDDYTVKIDKSVKEVRPYTVCAVVKGIRFSDDKIRTIIDIQEKLHSSIGRKRKKLAIGIYPLDKIVFPVIFKADIPENVKFIPLECDKILNGKQILKQHPTGIEFGDLLKGCKVFPFFEDANGEVLSMPPIINSDKTGRVTTNTTDIFIECSGFNLYYLNKVLNILVESLYLMGGKIYPVKIVDKNEKSFVSPNLDFERMPFNVTDINKVLGLNLAEREFQKLFAKMGIGYEKSKNQCFALIPPYRTDILHWIDLSEEIAIAYGYNNFKPILPQIATIAEEDKVSVSKKRIAEILAGLGLLETSSFHLTTKKDIKKIYYNLNDFIEIENSKTERNVLRCDLLTNAMQIYSENSDSVYPQKIFELGKVFVRDDSRDTGVTEKERLVVSIANDSATFTDVKQILDYLFKMLDKKYEIKNDDSHPAYISGREAIILVDGEKIGEIGEIAPRVLKNWKIKMPVVAFEIDIKFLI